MEYPQSAIYLEKINRLFCYLSALVLIVEWNLSNLLVIVFCLITVILINLNFIPFINEIILFAVYIITYNINGPFFTHTYIVMAITLIIWIIMLITMVKYYLKNK